jgi:hypothetical protein
MNNFLKALLIGLVAPSFVFAQLQTENSATPSGLNFKASWEKTPSNASWTQFSYELMDEELISHLDKAEDMQSFCPNFANLDREHQIYTWIELFSQVTYYESGWNPLSRMKENLGIDPVTGVNVYSEGLLQLSYQDMQKYPRAINPQNCQIDWQKDKNLSAKDPNKTILDPYINLECGMRIMADQIDQYGKIVISKDVYWSTLKKNGKYSVVPKIQKAIKKLSFCQSKKSLFRGWF